jgi:branched-subunit amino acid aminotransferase/4-amino-4-deoxychorismate lyase
VTSPHFATYGHYTSMQVRGGAVRGLARHLERLDAANREVFGRPLAGDDVRTRIREALRGALDAAVRVVVLEDGMVVEVSPPVDPPVVPQRLRSAPYARPFAHLKHLGTFAQAHHARLARAAGFDDTLLVGPDGLVTETSVANIGFLAGERVVWPEAPVLRGTTMQLLEAALARAGTPSAHRPVRLADLAGFDGAFLANSRGVSPVRGVDGVALPTARNRLAGLAALYAAVPAEAV